jgi:hypothetical protein
MNLSTIKRKPGEIKMDEPRLLRENEKIKSLQPAFVFHDRKSIMSLSQQAQLASDALMITQLLELLNDIQSEAVTYKDIDPSMIENGIQIIQNIKGGEDYLSQRKTNLMQRPNSANTVKYIKEYTNLQINESSDRVISMLNTIKDTSGDMSNFDGESLEFTKHFLRTIHSGIMDQLEASLPSNVLHDSKITLKT